MTLRPDVPPNWRALNQANRDERVAIHVNAPAVHVLDSQRAGTGQPDPIAADVLGPVDGPRVVHLQCHFGMDTLIVDGKAAHVVGLDFSPPAIETAGGLAVEPGQTRAARVRVAGQTLAAAVLLAARDEAVIRSARLPSCA